MTDDHTRSAFSTNEILCLTNRRTRNCKSEKNTEDDTIHEASKVIRRQNSTVATSLRSKVEISSGSSPPDLRPARPPADLPKSVSNSFLHLVVAFQIKLLFELLDVGIDAEKAQALCRV